jgi:uncharacterized membrane protein (UPF0127 family)
MRGFLLLALLTATGCGRTEEPASGQPEASAPLSPAAPAPQRDSRGSAEPDTSASASGPQGCVVELSPEPPPQAAPAARCPKDPSPRAEPPPAGHVSFVQAPGSPGVRVELAREPDAQRRGLMYRTELAPDAGMLFSWSGEAIRRFWMRNTCIPLDMLFIAADGTIVGIVEQAPVLSDAPQSIPCPARHVLEVNAGWARSHGVRPGQKVVIET